MANTNNERNDSFIRGILDSLSTQKDNSDFYDVVIQVGKKEFKSHRLILAATSGFFRGLFGSGMREDVEKKVHLEETAYSEQAIASVLEILYSGHSILTKENVVEIWSAANQLEILFLLKECEKFVLSIMNHESCVGIYQDGKLLDSKLVIETAWDYIIEHFDYVRHLSDMLSLEFEEIKKLVLSENIKTHSEDNVVDLILRWVAFGEETGKTDAASQSESPHRKTHLYDLLTSTRLCLVSGECLLSTLRQNKYVQENKELQPMIEESLKYNMMFDRRHDFCSPRAIHRNFGTLSNVILWEDKRRLYFKQTHGSKKCTIDRSVHHGDYHLSKTCGYGNKVFSATQSYASEIRFHETNLNTTSRQWQELPRIKAESDLILFKALGSNLFAIMKGTNQKVSLYRYDSSLAEKEWKCFQIDGTLEMVAASTTMDKVIIMLERCNDSIIGKYLDTETMNMSFLPGVKFETNATFVTFRKDGDAFVLQNNGILWRLTAMEGPLSVTFQQETMLWDFERTVYGAVLVNDELLLFGPRMPTSDTSNDNDVVWQISVPGVFDRIRNVSTTNSGQYLQTVINRDLLEK